MDQNVPSYPQRAGAPPDGVDVSMMPEEYFAVEGFFDSYVDSLRRSHEVIPGHSGNRSRVDGGVEVPALTDGCDAGNVGGGVVPRVENKGTARRKRATEANKAAQQRYRERKKEKIASMERELRDVQSKMAECSAVKKRNSYLEGINASLQEQIVKLEMELEKWRSVSTHDMDGDVDGDVDGENGVNGANGVGCGAQSREHSSKEHTSRDIRERESSLRSLRSSGNGTDGMEGVDGMEGTPGMEGVDVAKCCVGRGSEAVEVVDPAVFKEEFKSQVDALRLHLKKLGISERCAPGEGKVALHLTGDATSEFWGVIIKACQACHTCLSSHGPDIGAMMKEWCGEHRGMDDAGRTDAADGQGMKTPWQVALDAINLRDDQKNEILLLRSRHLENMKKLYEERQRLNLLAISKMVVAPADFPHDATIEGRIQSISTGTSLGLARNNASLGDLLDKIKGNLRVEQKAIMALNCTTLTQLLDCVQAARLIISLYPIHCDALALANAVYSEQGSPSAVKGGGE